MKILILSVVLVVIVFLLYNNSSNTTITIKQTTPQTITKDTSKDYKEIFTEPQASKKIEKIQDEQELKELDAQTDKLLLEAQKIIDKNHIDEKSIVLSDEEERVLQEKELELDNLQQKLQEIEDGY